MQIKAKCSINASDIRNQSFRRFIESGRNNTIKKRIAIFLAKNPNRSYSATELQFHLSIKYRSSVCNPLVELVDKRIINIVGVKYDHNTNREVGTYQIYKSDLL